MPKGWELLGGARPGLSGAGTPRANCGGNSICCIQPASAAVPARKTPGLGPGVIFLLRLGLGFGRGLGRRALNLVPPSLDHGTPRRAARRSSGPGSAPLGARRPSHLQGCPAGSAQLCALQLLSAENPGGGAPEEPVVLADVPPEAFLTVLEFLYTNSITLDRRTVLEVLISSLEYGLSELRELCVEFVVQNLDMELVCEALQVAVTFGLRQLREKCLNFIERHAQDVLRTPAFHELSPAALLAVLHSDHLAVDEVELVAATRHWARVSSAVLEQPMGQVAQAVVGELRLPLLSPSELSSLEEQNRVEPFIPVEQIAEAWKYHALGRGETTRGIQGRRRKGTAPRAHHHFLEQLPK
uniref:BTB/POZ domain-containing protein 19 isoform X1 n=1 Tax=Phascolarctos cinereus TaxID=38626 RepID=A0A6P5KEX6_PHACI|nr:BTB/POZ domain-containing protein 19 isoform X1 [Phascolarctos cinereus]